MTRARAGVCIVAATMAVGGCTITPLGTQLLGGEPPDAGNPMQEILRAHPGLAAIVGEAPRYRLQAVLGVFEPGEAGQPTLVQHGFRLGAEYFYPASTVKLFGAAAALERIAELREEAELPLSPATPLIYHPALEGQRLEARDATNLDGGFITVRHDVRKICLVSDNRAFNRLYELLGQDRLAASLARAGFSSAVIVHRLSDPRTPEENRRAPQIELVGETFRYTIPERTSEPLPSPPEIPGLDVGTAHFAAGEHIEAPMDFRDKNRVALAELQRALCTIVRPDVDCGARGFALDEADRALMVEALGQYPRESDNPVYDPDDYPDDYAKFILPGVLRVLPPDRVRVHDKTGWAYGFTTENAYVVDQETDRAFFLAVTIYTNSNDTLNDDDYDYESVARPFLADLGEAATRFVLGR